ncbi:hypothetical protein NPIL_169071 [Nephila pilipes]|uniref:Uncharacterized protein n=1 Tax=Nephila pilipes TaxID=299642 RepID=A0A8X6Q5L7_NEPPI|nr:hypothetical protein NPIL_169071 [Nephila pilipes]
MCRGSANDVISGTRGALAVTDRFLRSMHPLYSPASHHHNKVHPPGHGFTHSICSSAGAALSKRKGGEQQSVDCREITSLQLLDPEFIFNSNDSVNYF